jgi:prepilin-type N-terminal cleavage/methylation domain-containing protein
MSKHQKNTNENGFTLLELLVAITLIAVMSVGVWTALELCVRSWTRGIEAIEINQRDRNTYDLVRKQIASAYPLIPSSARSLDGQNTVIPISAASTPVFRGGENSMRFITPNSLLSMDSAGLVLVTYEAEVDSNGNIFIVQREAPYTGQDPDDGGFTSAAYVFYNLKECTFEYYNYGDANNPAEWLTEWDTASRRRLPAAVRISMLYKDARSGSPGRQMIIPLRAQYNYLQAQSSQQIRRRQPTPRKP